jgi:CubicO group peptidase (beta-lactamase class C family)
LVPGGEYYNQGENFHTWKPGEKFDYSNIGFGLLGVLVEVLSGSSFSDYCKANIFGPLDMQETSWYLADLDLTKHALPYTFYTNGETRGEIMQEQPKTANPQEGDGFIPNCLYSFPNISDGLLRTSIHQLANFLICHMNNGFHENVHLLQETTVEKIFTSQLDPTYVLDEQRNIGLTWYLGEITPGFTYWMHGGSDPGISTLMGFNTTYGIGVIVFTNTGWAWTLEEIVKRLFVQALKL